MYNAHEAAKEALHQAHRLLEFLVRRQGARPATGVPVLKCCDASFQLIDAPVQGLDVIALGAGVHRRGAADQFTRTFFAERHLPGLHVHAHETIVGSLQTITLRVLRLGGERNGGDEQ